MLLTVPPNVKYEERFRKAYREAVENERGLWKRERSERSYSEKVYTNEDLEKYYDHRSRYERKEYTVEEYESPGHETRRYKTQESPSRFRCGEKYYCSQMSSCEEAMFYYTICGLKRLDGDRDGIPCETLCR